ncbi:MAG: RIP metalloprotease RseP [candidate division WOR-3 bacterium]
MEGEDFGETGFFAAPLWKKTAVLVFGPSSNLVLGAVLFAVMFGVFGLRHPEPRISAQPGSPAAMAGIERGDLLLSINGDTVRSLDDLESKLRGPDSVMFNLRLRRDTLAFIVQLAGPAESLGIEEFARPGVISVGRGTPAARAGIKAGDMLAAVDSVEITTPQQFTQIVASRPGETLTIVLLRGKETLALGAVPMTILDSTGREKGLLGVTIGQAIPTSRVRVGLGTAAWEAIRYTGRVVVKTFVILYELLTAQVSPRAVSGPVMVGKILYEGVQSGAEMLLAIWALLSINLFVINMLPIPFMDGGRALLFAIEGLRGRHFTQRTWEISLRVGLHLVILLVIFALSNDFLNILNITDHGGTWSRRIQIGLLIAYAAYGIVDLVRPPQRPSGEANQARDGTDSRMSSSGD